MLISNEIEVKLHGKKIKHYESLGYILPKHKTKDGMRVPPGSSIMVKVEDIPLQSHVFVNIKCDYCGKEYPTRYDGYIKRKQNDINLDCCEDCKSTKNKELNLLRYGVENQFQREEIIHKTMFMKSKNNSIVYSNQQLYLCRLFNGTLNYVDETTCGCAIDIALVDKKIAIEYNGSGHNLQVQFGNITQKEFENKEIVRYLILKRNGWKQIKIDSPRDFLPSDEILLQELENALEWFKSDEFGHYHYDIKIGNKRDSDKYGKLRKIREVDIKTNIN